MEENNTLSLRNLLILKKQYERLVWVRKHYSKITNTFEYACDLDEKWLYTTNLQNKIKKCPKENNDNEGVDVVLLNIISRRFPVKSMFLGVAGRPLPRILFNSKALLKQASEEVLVTKLISRQSFIDDIFINCAIKLGKWIHIFDLSSMLSCIDILDGITVFYELNNAVTGMLEFSHTTFIGNAGNTKEIKLESKANIFEVEFRMNSNKKSYNPSHY